MSLDSLQYVEMKTNESEEEGQVSLVETLTVLAQTLQPPLDTNEWLEPEGDALSLRGLSMCVELAWDAFAALVPHATGDGGLADQALAAVCKGLSAKELNLLASETLGPFHGDAGFGGMGAGFGFGGNTDFEGYPGGVLGPVAVASRSALLVSILRCESDRKRVPMVEMALHEISRLLRRPPPSPPKKQPQQQPSRLTLIAEDGGENGGEDGSGSTGKEEEQGGDEEGDPAHASDLPALGLLALVDFIEPIVAAAVAGGKAVGIRKEGPTSAAAASFSLSPAPPPPPSLVVQCSSQARLRAGVVQCLLDAAAATGAVPAVSSTSAASTSPSCAYCALPSSSASSSSSASPPPPPYIVPAAVEAVWDSLARMTFLGANSGGVGGGGGGGEGGGVGEGAGSSAQSFALHRASSLAPWVAPFSTSSTSTSPLAVVDDAWFLIAQPWRFAHALFRVHAQHTLHRRRRKTKQTGTTPSNKKMLKKKKKQRPPSSLLLSTTTSSTAAGTTTKITTTTTPMTTVTMMMEDLSVGNLQHHRQASSAAMADTARIKPWSSLGLARLVFWALRHDLTHHRQPNAGTRNHNALVAAADSDHISANAAETGAAGAVGSGAGSSGNSSSLVSGLWVQAPWRLWQLLAPHAFTLLLHSSHQGQGTGGDDGDDGLAYGDGAAGEALLRWLAKRLPSLSLARRGQGRRQAQEQGGEDEVECSDDGGGGEDEGDQGDQDEEEEGKDEAALYDDYFGGQRDRDEGRQSDDDDSDNDDDGEGDDEGSDNNLTASFKNMRRQRRRRQEANQLPFHESVVVSASFHKWEPQVNLLALLPRLVDVMVTHCGPNQTRRSQLKATIQQILAAHDDASALLLLKRLIPSCPHPQAKAWLLDLHRRRLAVHLEALLARCRPSPAAAPAAAPLTAPATAVAAVALPLPTRSDQKKRNRLCFLGDEGLKLLLTDPLKRMAAETKPQALLDSLDVHLATLATLRLLLLKRKNLLTLLAAQSAYTDANTPTPRGEEGGGGGGDEGGNDTSCVPASAPPGCLCSSKTLGVWQRAVGTLKATLTKAARPLVPTTTTATTATEAPQENLFLLPTPPPPPALSVSLLAHRPSSSSQSNGVQLDATTVMTAPPPLPTPVPETAAAAAAEADTQTAGNQAVNAGGNGSVAEVHQEPTPSLASFHLMLLAEAVDYAHELLAGASSSSAAAAAAAGSPPSR